ncbi:MAG: helix-turn-helix domain-containing protein [Pseudomonadaceae bacterium]|nr:helix-turn-helix domain-containing protein [Pseudomonadaceae bacterium]
MFTIGEISKKVDVKIPTIRYYEKMGLLTEPSRSEGNQRRYTQAELEQLGFIKHARDLGFPLDTIRSLINLSQTRHQDCSAVDELARQHLQQVRDRLSLLNKLESELERIVGGCQTGVVEQCYVIESLAHHELCLGSHSR